MTTIDSGLEYCVAHHGIVDVDQDHCDNARDLLLDEQPDCLTRPLYYEDDA